MRRSRNMKHLNFNMCFLSSTTTPESKSPPPTTTTTTHHQIHDIHDDPNSPYSTSSPIMIKNFNSLYDHPTTLTFDHSFFSSSLSNTTTTTTTISSIQVAEPDPEPADFAAAFASQRFFFSTPGSSNSLTEYNKYSSPLLMDKSKKEEEKEKEKDKEEEKVLFNGSVAVPTYSPDPYLDFRRSMQEMVEARPELMDVKSNWNVLHELLLCYLALNPKSTHKFILGAFADLVVNLMSF